MEKKSDIYWYLGVRLDKYNESDDKIEIIEFYNSYNKKVYAHFNTSYEKKSGDFRFEDYHSENFKDWKKELKIVIPLETSRFEKLKEINTANHKSLKKFLKAFGFEEYLI